MTGPVVIGLDLSLTSTGVATPTGEHRISTMPTSTLADRLRSFATSVARVIDEHHPVDLVVVEDLPKNVRFGGVDLGMIHGVFRYLWDDIAGPPLAWIPPATLKKYATGKGAAKKDEMLAAAIRRLGYGGHHHDEADAMWLRAAGHDRLGDPLAVLPVAQRLALDAIDWPTVPKVAA